MAQTPSQQIQVIPQHLSAAQLQQLYMPQQHILLPGNVTLQQGGTLASPNVSLQLQAKTPGDSKTFGVQNIQPYQNALILQPKPTFSGMQNPIHVKQMAPRTNVGSGTLYSHPQLLGSYALSPLPPGYAWSSSPNSFPCSQNPIIISREQPNIYVQSQSQAAIQLPVVPGQFMAPTSLSCSHISQGVQSIATQTTAPSSLNSGTICYPPQNLPQVENVETSTAMVNSTISEKLMQPSMVVVPLLNEPPSTEDTKTIASLQTETVPVTHELKSVTKESQFHSMPTVQTVESVPVLNIIPTEMPDDVCSSPSSAVSSTSTALEIQQPILSTEELSCESVSESQPVPEQMMKPTADVKPVPEKADSSADVPVNVNINKSPGKLTNEQKIARFNPVIKLKRLKPHDPILTPYSRVMKDKQPQKAIVKPQMLSPVIDSYVIQEVTLKSVVDSSSTDISESSNSEDKSETIVPGISTAVSSSSIESSVQIVKGIIPEKQKQLPVIKVGRGRGRPRGRPPKKKRQIIPTRRSLRQQEVIICQPPSENDQMNPNRRSPREQTAVSLNNSNKEHSSVDKEENLSKFAANSSRYMTDDLNFPPYDTTDSDLSFDISTLAAVSSEIGKVVTDVHKKPPDSWSVQEVFDFVQNFPGCLEFAETFKAQEIDGQALLLMNLDHLMTGMNMKLGPALKLIAHISSMKEQGHLKLFEAVGGKIEARVQGAGYPHVKRRGRPPTHGGDPLQKDYTTNSEVENVLRANDESLFINPVKSRGRGRPRKKIEDNNGLREEENARQTNDENLLSGVKEPRKRGRPRKKIEVNYEESDLSDDEVYRSLSLEKDDPCLFCDISNFHTRRQSRSRSRVRRRSRSGSRTVQPSRSRSRSIQRSRSRSKSIQPSRSRSRSIQRSRSRSKSIQPSRSRSKSIQPSRSRSKSIQRCRSRSRSMNLKQEN